MAISYVCGNYYSHTSRITVKLRIARAIREGDSESIPTLNKGGILLENKDTFAWQGECDIHIDDLLNGKKQQPENQLAKAKRLIEDALRYGAAAASEIMRLAEEQGISPKTLNRAKSDLGVVSTKRGDGWYWEMPIDVAYTEVNQDDRQDGQDGHTPPVTALTIFPGRKEAV